MRRAAKIDNSQSKIVEALRAIPGVTVELGHDDILVGYDGRTYWYELKDPETAVSKKTGKILESAKKDNQKRLEKEWQGHYSIVSDIDDILCDLDLWY